MNTLIKVNCIDQVLTLENTPTVASGGLNEDYVEFSFCSKWDDLEITAVFCVMKRTPTTYFWTRQTAAKYHQR